MRPGARAVQGLLGLFLLWLYPGDLIRCVQAQRAEVAMLTELPSWVLSIVGTLSALVLAATWLISLRRPARWPPRRWALVVSSVVLFVDFTVFASRRPPLTAEQQLLLAIDALSERAAEASVEQGLPRDGKVLEPMVTDLGDAPVFLKGERAAWHVQVRDRCDGPATEAGDAAAGTLIYCVSTDLQRAWVTVVANPLGSVFGPRAVVSSEGPWVGEVVSRWVPPERP